MRLRFRERSAVLQSLELAIGVRDLDEERLRAHRVPVQTERLPRSEPGVRHHPPQHGGRKKIPAVAGSSDEALCRTRTGDPFLTMEVLYQLS